MALLIQSDGIVKQVFPEDGIFTLEELQRFVSGPIELLDISPNHFLVCNEEGRVRRLPFNLQATKFVYRSIMGPRTFICGDVLIVSKDLLK